MGFGNVLIFFFLSFSFLFLFHKMRLIFDCVENWILCGDEAHFYLWGSGPKHEARNNKMANGP